MTALWVLWVFYSLAFFADLLYVQPYRRRRAAEQGALYKAGSISFGLRAALPVVTVALLARTFVVDVYRIPTASMEPNLHQGSTIWVNRMAYGLRSPITGVSWLRGPAPEAGDVIVFQYPREPRTTYVKRVLGVPGDHIVIDGDRIQRNGEIIYAPDHQTNGPNTHTVRIGDVSVNITDDPLVQSTARIDLQVPDDHFFALGDNINDSEDSRTWGLLSSRHLIGKVSL